MEVDVKVLEEIAQDKEVVGWLEKAVEKGTLLVDCPFPTRRPFPSRHKSEACPRLCGKIWPDINDAITKGNYGGCSCSKPHRLEIAQAIIALSKLVPEPKTYRVGDVFEIDGYINLLCCVGDGVIQFILLSDGNRWREPSAISKQENAFTGLPLSRIEKALNARTDRYKYLGHISELTIKNGKVVTP